jgi:putative PIN family toxin of toxin-antitoxin system
MKKELPKIKWKILSMPIENKKPKVVIDTNVFISGLNFTGKPHEILELFINNEIEVFISSFILYEIEKILRKKFEWDREQVERVLNRIKGKALQVKPKTKISVVKGKEDDNRILECAVEAGAQYIISGDKRHLLPLKEYQGIKILSPSDFLEVMPFSNHTR